MNNDFDKDTCVLIEKIKNILYERNVNTLTNYKLKDRFYLITDFMIITYSEEDNVLDIAFHISTRPDISAFFVLELKNLDEIKYINVMEVYMKNENGDILTGDKCIDNHKKNIRNNIIDEFLGEEIQLHYLKTNHVGSMC